MATNTYDVVVKQEGKADSKITYLSDDTELEEFMRAAGNRLVVLDFFALWCRPCKRMLPHLERMAKEMTDVLFVKINIDDCDDESLDKYDVCSVPAYVIVRGTRIVASVGGAHPDVLEDMIKKIRSEGDTEHP